MSVSWAIDIVPVYPLEDQEIAQSELSFVFSLDNENLNERGLEKSIFLIDDQNLSNYCETYDFALTCVLPDEIKFSPNMRGSKSITLIYYHSELSEQEVLSLWESGETGNDSLIIVEFTIEIKESSTEEFITEQERTVYSQGTVYTNHLLDYNSSTEDVKYSGELGGSGSSYFGERYLNYSYFITTSVEDNQSSPQRFRLSYGKGERFRIVLGDNSEEMNSFILRNERVRGGRLFLQTPQKRTTLELIAGITRSSIAPYIVDANLLENAEQVHDSLYALDQLQSPFGHNDSLLYQNPGTYLRRAYGGRISFGTGKTFRTGTTILTIRDMVNSIDQLYTEYTMQNDSLYDTLYIRYGKSPKDNLLLGQEFDLYLWDKKLSLSGAAALSVYTEDSHYPAATDLSEMDSVHVFEGIDALENFQPLIIFNSSTLPFPTTHGILNSSAFEGKFSLRLPLSGGFQGADIGYRQVGPNYRSLGYESLQRDLRTLFIDENLRLFENKLLASISLDLSEDNISTDESEPTRSLGLQSRLGYYPTGEGVSLGINHTYYANINNSSDSSYYRDDKEFSLMGNASYYHTFTYLKHRFSGHYSYRQYRNSIIDALHQHSISTKLHTYYPGDRVQSRVAFSHNRYDNENTTRYYSISLGTDLKIVPNTITFKGDFKLSLATKSSDIITLRLGSRFTINEHHSLLFDLESKQSLDNDEGRLYAQLSYRFNY